MKKEQNNILTLPITIQDYNFRLLSYYHSNISGYHTILIYQNNNTLEVKSDGYALDTRTKISEQAFQEFYKFLDLKIFTEINVKLIESDLEELLNEVEKIAADGKNNQINNKLSDELTDEINKYITEFETKKELSEKEDEDFKKQIEEITGTPLKAIKELLTLPKYDRILTDIKNENLNYILIDYEDLYNILKKYKIEKLLNGQFQDFKRDIQSYLFTEDYTSNDNLDVILQNMQKNKDVRLLKSKDIGKLISTTATVKNIENRKARLKKGIFQCRSCMKIISVEQTNSKRTLEPTICTSCSGK